MVSNPLSPPGAWETFSEIPLASKVVLFGVLINRLSGFLQIFVVFFLISLGYSQQETIIALAIYGAGSVLGSLLGGAISEQLGVRATSMISMGSTAVLTATLLYQDNYIIILTVVALASLSAQLFRPASSILLSEQTPSERQTMVFAIYRLGLNLGATGAPLIGYALYKLGGNSFTFLFWGEAIIAGLYALLAMMTLPGRSKSVTHSDNKNVVKGGYRQVLSDRRFVLFLLATFCHSVVFVQYITTLPMYVADQNIPLFWYTFAISLNGIIVVGFELFITKYTQKYEKRKMLAIGFVLVGTGVSVYGLPIGPAALIVGTLIWSLGEIMSGPAFFAFPANAGPSKFKAYYLGSFHFMFSLGIALGPIIGGWLYLTFDNAVWPIVSLGSFFAAAVCGLYAIEHVKNKNIKTGTGSLCSDVDSNH